jgi:hypothetical protein
VKKMDTTRFKLSATDVRLVAVAICLNKFPWCNTHAGIIFRDADGGPRIRPQEVAGACLEDVLPATFSQCSSNGEYILAMLTGQLSAGAH